MSDQLNIYLSKHVKEVPLIPHLMNFSVINTETQMKKEVMSDSPIPIPSVFYPLTIAPKKGNPELENESGVAIFATNKEFSLDRRPHDLEPKLKQYYKKQNLHSLPYIKKKTELSSSTAAQRLLSSSDRKVP